jgi:hypothetical protein
VSETGICILGGALITLGMLLIVGMLEVDYAQALKGRGGMSGHAMRVVMVAGAMVAVGGVVLVVFLGGAV